MNILITGGTGFIGTALTTYFNNKNYQVSILTRSIGKQSHLLSTTLLTSLNPETDKFDVIINLAGESLFNKRWTVKQKQKIIDSRINTTNKIIEFIARAKYKPLLLINGSAIGIYGSNCQHNLDENADITATDFASKLCILWEKTAEQASQYGMRVCCLRLGIVLDKKGGMLQKMFLPFKLGLGSILGKGQQNMSWISMYDLLSVVDFIIKHDLLHGAINACSPNLITNKEFSYALATALKRKCLMRVPTIFLKLMCGKEMTENLLISSHKVIPQKLLHHGFVFDDNDIKQYLLEHFA